MSQRENIVSFQWNKCQACRKLVESFFAYVIIIDMGANCIIRRKVYYEINSEIADGEQEEKVTSVLTFFWK